MRATFIGCNTRLECASEGSVGVIGERGFTPSHVTVRTDEHRPVISNFADSFERLFRTVTAAYRSDEINRDFRPQPG